MAKNLNRYFIILFLLLFTPLLIRFLIINKRSKFINNLYFNSPIYIKNTNKCFAYDQLLKNKLDNSFSVSIIDENGTLIGSYNQNTLRLPASNLKLFSTAYALNNYKITDNLKTSILKNIQGTYYIVGQGDPDLTYKDIRKLISNITYSSKIVINILEINKRIYWPKGWTNTDKLNIYGSPISTLAINSNENNIQNIEILSNYIRDYIYRKYPLAKVEINIRDYDDKFYIKNAREIDINYSNPLLSLLTLSNSESHNFTAESLFKNASNTWNTNNYTKLKGWLGERGLPIENSNFSDASGLSRNNRITTKLISQFLHKMKYSRSFNTYKSTLSIMGIRGTLANNFKNSELNGKFFGKTGTLSNVFAISGYLYKSNKPIVLSIIQNSDYIDKTKSLNLINDIYNLETCN